MLLKKNRLLKRGAAVSLAALMLAAAVPASAFSLAPGSLEANLNNETIQFEYERPLKTSSNLYFNLGALYSEEDERDSASLFTLGFQGVETDNRTYRAAVGMRLYGYSAPVSTSGFALALGGLFYHVLPGATHISMGGHGFVAPQVTSFGDTEYIYEAGVRLAYRVIQNTDAFLGYRYLHLKSDETGFNDPLAEGFHLGFRINF